VTGHCRILGFDAHHSAALLLKGVLHNTEENANGSDKPVLSLRRNRRARNGRPCRYPAQLNVIEEHATEPTGELGGKAPV
jgi:hypothetical protein